MLQRVMSQFFVEIFVSQYRKTLKGNPSILCFGKFLVVKKFMNKGQGKYQDLSSQVFCPTVPKNAVGYI